MRFACSLIGMLVVWYIGDAELGSSLRSCGYAGLCVGLLTKESSATTDFNDRLVSPPFAKSCRPLPGKIIAAVMSNCTLGHTSLR